MNFYSQIYGSRNYLSFYDNVPISINQNCVKNLKNINLCGETILEVMSCKRILTFACVHQAHHLTNFVVFHTQTHLFTAGLPRLWREIALI